jgi:hypothetical protein
MNKPQPDITALGTNLSVSLHITIAGSPVTIQESEKAPEVIVLVQLNSVNNGLKKTP